MVHIATIAAGRYVLVPAIAADEDDDEIIQNKLVLNLADHANRHALAHEFMVDVDAESGPCDFGGTPGVLLVVGDETIEGTVRTAFGPLSRSQRYAILPTTVLETNRLCNMQQFAKNWIAFEITAPAEVSADDLVIAIGAHVVDLTIGDDYKFVRQDGPTLVVRSGTPEHDALGLSVVEGYVDNTMAQIGITSQQVDALRALGTPAAMELLEFHIHDYNVEAGYGLFHTHVDVYGNDRADIHLALLAYDVRKNISKMIALVRNGDPVFRALGVEISSPDHGISWCDIDEEAAERVAAIGTPDALTVAAGIRERLAIGQDRISFDHYFDAPTQADPVLLAA